ncbi:MAG: hypothetical protein V8Q05_05055 [Lachnospiraceae bacterium]
MVYGVTDHGNQELGCSMIAEEWESYDELLRERKDLRRGGYIVEERNSRDQGGGGIHKTL